MVGTQHGMDWRRHPVTSEHLFYIMNSQECEVLRFSDYTTSVPLNVIWGILFLLLGIVVIGANIHALRGLYITTTKSGEFLNPVIYTNVSILNVVFGLCTLVSGSIMLSNFTWDESDGAGEFLCNIFGVLFTLVVQTKVLLMTSGLFIAVICQIAGVKMQTEIAVRISAVVVVLCYVFGFIHAFLPYMFGSTYSQPDYLLISVGSFSGMSYDETENYYSGQQVMYFIPLFVGLILCLFTIPGMIFAKQSKMFYKWEDDMWNVFSMTSLFMSYLVCHATYYIVHLSGMSELDNNTSIDFCDLDLYDMRYFFAFMVFSMYFSGIAEPLSYLIANLNIREKLFPLLPNSGIEGNNRVTPMLVDIRHQGAHSAASGAKQSAGPARGSAAAAESGDASNI